MVVTGMRVCLARKLWHAVNTALIDEVVSRSKARGDHFKPILSTTQFREDQPTLVRIEMCCWNVGLSSGTFERDSERMVC